MKFIALCGIILVFLVAATAVTLPTGRIETRPVSSSAQVSVDGVPVCVFSHAGRIIAGVGRCGIEVPVPEPGSPAAEGISPEMSLPPGHPPIDGAIDGESPRRIRI